MCRVPEIDGTMQDVHKAVVGEPIPISYYEALSVVFVHTHLLNVPGLNQGTAWLRSPSVVFTLSQRGHSSITTLHSYYY